MIMLAFFENLKFKFRYGEDGMDIGRSTFLNPKLYPFLLENVSIMQKSILFSPKTISADLEDEKWHLAETEKHYKQITKFKRRRIEQLVL